MKKNLPIIYFSSAFFFSFILFFVRPLFFNENLVMKEMLLVPYLKPIGIDLTQYLDFIHSWLNGTQVQFSDSNIYPPLCNIVLLPLLFFESYSVQFFVLSLISFLSFL